jgi:hypothetical protein
MAYPTVTEHHKRYPFTDVMSSPYSCDPTGVLDCASAIESIKANESNAGGLFFSYGSYLIDTALTIPSGMSVTSNAPVSILVEANLTISGRLNTLNGLTFTTATTATLTINGTIQAGDEQIFFGTGAINYNSPTPPNAKWFTPANGVSDDYTALQAAYNSINTNGKHDELYCGYGTYKLSSPIALRAGVSIRGSGPKTVFVPTGGTCTAFTLAENCGEIATSAVVGVWRDFVSYCKIDSSANNNGGYQIDLTGYRYFGRSIHHVSFIGNKLAAQGAIKHQTDLVGGSAVHAYSNLVDQCFFGDICGANTGAIYLAVTAASGTSPNQWVLSNFSVRNDGTWKRFMYASWAKALLIENGQFVTAISDPIQANGSGGSGVHFEFGEIGQTNTTTEVSIKNIWFEGAGSTTVVVLEKSYSATVNGLVMDSCNPVSAQTQLWMPSIFTTTPLYWTVTYVSDTQVTIASDATASLKDDYKVMFTGSDGKWYSSTLNGDSTVALGVTTVNINDARFPANVTTLFRAVDYNNSNGPNQGLKNRGTHYLPAIKASKGLTVGPDGTQIKRLITGTAAYAGGTINDGVYDGSNTITMDVGLGDLVLSVSLNKNLQGVICEGFVSAANTVTVILQNETGGNKTLTAGTLTALVAKLT